MARVEVFPAGELEFVLAEGGKISGEPVFYGSGREMVPILVLVVKDAAGAVVHRYSLRISGSELKLSLQERSSPVPPAYEVPADKLKPPSGPKKEGKD